MTSPNLFIQPLQTKKDPYAVIAVTSPSEYNVSVGNFFNESMYSEMTEGSHLTLLAFTPRGHESMQEHAS